MFSLLSNCIKYINQKLVGRFSRSLSACHLYNKKQMNKQLAIREKLNSQLMSSKICKLNKQWCS